MSAVLSFPLLITLLISAAVLLALAWWTRLRWRPAWVLRMALVAIALAVLFAPKPVQEQPELPDRQVMIVDMSDSVPDSIHADSRLRALSWLAGGANRLLVAVAADSQTVLAEGWPRLDGRASDLEGGLELAAGLLGSDPGEIILVSDGQVPYALSLQASVAELKAQGHRLSVIPLAGADSSGDLYVEPLLLPSALWENTAYSAVLPVQMPEAADVHVLVLVNNQIEVDQSYELTAGPNFLAFNLRTFAEEIMTITAVVTAENDPVPENNSAHAALRVFPAPNVLIVSEDAGTSRSFAAALEAAGLQTDTFAPGIIPTSVGDLERYQVIILHNFLAEAISDAQMATLERYVSELGRGLIFLGGRNAYTLGGYRNTLLEPMLPVQLRPPPRTQHAPVTFVLAFDRSASMSPRNTPIKPIDLAREAAMRAVESLSSEDYLGVLTYNTSAVWTVPLASVGDGLRLREAQDAISQVQASGGTNIFEALETAVTGLTTTPTSETRHILLLSDGRSSDGSLEDFELMAEFAQEQGITISTIALGVDADHELMSLIAAAGNGRFYPVQHAGDLPRILVAESQAARSENLHIGETQLAPGEPDHPILFGFSPAELPRVDGYNALESKADQGAEDVLVSGTFQDPMLSVWQYGLGRVAVWTSDIGEEWGRDWTDWDRVGQFWGQVVRYALPDPSAGPGQVQVNVGPTQVEILAQLGSAAGIPLNGLSVTYAYVDADGQVRSFSMPQRAPGQYALTLDRPPEGIYRGVVRYAPSGESPVEIAAPIAADYPLEWVPGATAVGYANLASWADESDAGIVTWELLEPPVPETPTAEIERTELINLLLIILIITWPLEIALRRRWLPWR
jgi:Mg-chelatase subunit ChlD